MVACAAVSPTPSPIADPPISHPDLFQRLVKSTRVSEANPVQVHIEIDFTALRALQSNPDWREGVRLLDPVTSAMAFAPAIGIPPGGNYTLLGQAARDETEAGYPLATVLVRLNDARQIEVRMIGEPGPTSEGPFWVPNDVTQRTH